MQRVYIGIQSHLITRLPEWVLGSCMLGEGLLFLQAGNMLESTRAYHPLRQIAGEDVWGWAAAAIGGTWLIALFLNGTFNACRRVSPWARAVCALGTCFYMTLFATGMWIGNPAGDGYLMHGMFAAMALAKTAIIAREVHAVDKDAKRWRHPNRPTSPIGL